MRPCSRRTSFVRRNEGPGAKLNDPFPSTLAGRPVRTLKYRCTHPRHIHIIAMRNACKMHLLIRSDEIFEVGDDNGERPHGQRRNVAN